MNNNSNAPTEARMKNKQQSLLAIMESWVTVTLTTVESLTSCSFKICDFQYYYCMVLVQHLNNLLLFNIHFTTSGSWSKCIAVAQEKLLLSEDKFAHNSKTYPHWNW